MSWQQPSPHPPPPPPGKLFIKATEWLILQVMLWLLLGLGLSIVFCCFFLLSILCLAIPISSSVTSSSSDGITSTVFPDRSEADELKEGREDDGVSARDRAALLSSSASTESDTPSGEAVACWDDQPDQPGNQRWNRVLLAWSGCRFGAGGGGDWRALPTEAVAAAAAELGGLDSAGLGLLLVSTITEACWREEKRQFP